MAYDRLVDSAQLEADLTSIADSIRTKAGNDEKLVFPNGFVNAVNSIESGGGADEALAEVEYALSNGFTDYSDLFYNLQQMYEVPMGILQHISNGTRFENMFLNATNLIEIPDLDLQNAKNMAYFVSGCTNLERIGVLTTPNLDSVANMFNGCKKLHTIGGIDFTKITSSNFSGTFKNCSALENFTVNGIIRYGFANFSYCTLLTHDSLMSMINALKDLVASGLSSETLTIGSTNLAKLTDTEKAIATQKGWTLA